MYFKTRLLWCHYFPLIIDENSLNMNLKTKLSQEPNYYMVYPTVRLQNMKKTLYLSIKSS